MSIKVCYNITYCKLYLSHTTAYDCIKKNVSIMKCLRPVAEHTRQFLACRTNTMNFDGFTVYDKASLFDLF